MTHILYRRDKKIVSRNFHEHFSLLATGDAAHCITCLQEDARGLAFDWVDLDPAMAKPTELEWSPEGELLRMEIKIDEVIYTIDSLDDVE